MKKEKKYYGIYFNSKIPKLDKKNKYNKEVEIKFEGKAYLIQRKEKDKIEKIEIKNEHQLKKEGDYEIEFINLKKEIYQLHIRIENSWLCLILLLFFLGFIVIFLFTRPIGAKEKSLAQICDYIDLSILPLDINKDQEIDEKIKKDEKEQKSKNQYDFDITLKNRTSANINLINTIATKSLAHNKVAPGTRGSFSITISARKSTVDMKYYVNFEDLTYEKPTNMIFKIQGDNKIYTTLQELEKSLIGVVHKKSKKVFTIDWEWAYETGESEKTIVENDKTDTMEGEKLKSYEFRILVTGEEVV